MSYVSFDFLIEQSVENLVPVHPTFHEECFYVGSAASDDPSPQTYLSAMSADLISLLTFE